MKKKKKKRKKRSVWDEAIQEEGDRIFRIYRDQDELVSIAVLQAAYGASSRGGSGGGGGDDQATPFDGLGEEGEDDIELEEIMDGHMTINPHSNA